MSPPVAVKVVVKEPPELHTVVFPPIKAVGRAFTVTLRVAVAVQPLLVTVTV